MKSLFKNNNASLTELDGQLESARRQIKKLEAENTYLKNKVRTRGTSETESYQNQEFKNAKSKIIRLQRDNHFLRERLELEKNESTRDARYIVSKLNMLEDQKQQYLRQNDSLKRVIALGPELWERRVKETEKKALTLEVENKALWQQAQVISRTQRREREEQEVFVLKLEKELARLEARNEELENQMTANLGFMRKTIAEKERLMLQNTRYQRKIDSLYNSNSQVQKNLRFEPFTEKLHQRMDSLEYENTSLKRQVTILNTTENVKQSRIRDLEAREAALQEAKFRMEIRDQLTSDREKDLRLREQELELKEVKFEGLVEKEKRLKMIEQRLRNAVND